MADVSKLTAEELEFRDDAALAADISGYNFEDADMVAKLLNIDPPFDDGFDEALRFSFRAQAALRYAIADAMLAARKGSGEV